MADIPMLACNPGNYGGQRDLSQIKYIVVHYTAGHNDTAENNGIYFGREQVGASAHYFVDEGQVIQSVPVDRVAWHCGGMHYLHPECRNSNSIGVEICSKYTAGVYHFAPEAVARAQQFVKELMARYHIPIDHVVRHYDVTGKVCPAPMVLGDEGKRAWDAFKQGLVGDPANSRELMLRNVPDWAKPTITKLLDKELIKGDGYGDLGLYNREVFKVLVILDRAGVFDHYPE